VFLGPSKWIGAEVFQHLATVHKYLETGIEPPPPPFISFLILHWPQPGANMMVPVFGFGDLTFIALLLAACRRFNLPLLKGVVLILAGLGFTIVNTLVLRQSLPVLPLICAFFLIGNLPTIATRS
jgi:hypothetical protein